MLDYERLIDEFHDDPETLRWLMSQIQTNFKTEAQILKILRDPMLRKQIYQAYLDSKKAEIDTVVQRNADVIPFIEQVLAKRAEDEATYIEQILSNDEDEDVEIIPDYITFERLIEEAYRTRLDNCFDYLYSAISKSLENSR